MSTRPMGLIKGLSFEAYLEVEAFSNTAMKLLARSAWHYKNRIPVKRTRPMLCGSLAHCAQLEPQALAERYCFVPEGAPKRPTEAQWNAAKSNESSTQAKAWWKEFLDAQGDREVITADEYAILKLQLAAIANDPEISDMLAAGDSEVSIFWVDQESGVYCKARPDHVRYYPGSNRVRLLDLKTTADESPDRFGQQVARMGWGRQAVHYAAGFEAVTGMRVEKFVLAAVTNQAPVLAVPYELTDEIADQERDEWRRLMDLYAYCHRENRWPAYGVGIQKLDYPAWAKRSGEVEVSYVEE